MLQTDVNNPQPGPSGYRGVKLTKGEQVKSDAKATKVEKEKKEKKETKEKKEEKERQDKQDIKSEQKKKKRDGRLYNNCEICHVITVYREIKLSINLSH